MKLITFFTLVFLFGCGTKPVEPEQQTDDTNLPPPPSSISLVDESTGDLRWFMPGGPVFEFVRIQPGTFIMGEGTEENPQFLQRESPKHEVTITRDFYIGKFEVTATQWIWLMGKTSIFDPNRQVYTEIEPFDPNISPIHNVEFREVQAFIDSLNKNEGRDAFRLPTEAEWEYACKAGTTGRYWFGPNYRDRHDRYNLVYAPGTRTILSPTGPAPDTDNLHKIGWSVPNPWGIYDMHRNVAEWVIEGEFRQYTADPQTDPIASTANSSLSFELPDFYGGNRTVTYLDIHLFRGGAYNLPDYHTRSTYRGYIANANDGPKEGIGFRLVRSIIDNQ